ncbi:hypothetical protein FB451DRAFT_1566613 [Mycena latifolia]|nr:hypothetical protein FB451DRAFT_1566613 [Mycena latifolia]
MKCNITFQNRFQVAQLMGHVEATSTEGLNVCSNMSPMATQLGSVLHMRYMHVAGMRKYPFWSFGGGPIQLVPPTALRRSYPIALRRSYPIALQRSYPTAPLRSYPTAPLRSYPIALRCSYPTVPLRSYPTALRRSYPIALRRSYRIVLPLCCSIPTTPLCPYPTAPLRSYPSLTGCVLGRLFNDDATSHDNGWPSTLRSSPTKRVSRSSIHPAVPTAHAHPQALRASPHFYARSTAPAKFSPLRMSQLVWTKTTLYASYLPFAPILLQYMPLLFSCVGPSGPFLSPLHEPVALGASLRWAAAGLLPL